MNSLVAATTFGSWAWVRGRPSEEIGLIALAAIGVVLFILNNGIPLLKKLHRPSFSITVHPASFSKNSASIPLFIVNRSAYNRIVLDFALCLPLSNSQEYRASQVWFNEIRRELGPQEYTSGHLSFMYGSPRGSDTFLFSEAYIFVTDVVSIQSVKVKIPGTFPPE